MQGIVSTSGNMMWSMRFELFAQCFINILPFVICCLFNQRMENNLNLAVMSTGPKIELTSPLISGGQPRKGVEKIQEGKIKAVDQSLMLGKQKKQPKVDAQETHKDQGRAQPTLQQDLSNNDSIYQERHIPILQECINEQKRLKAQENYIVTIMVSVSVGFIIFIVTIFSAMVSQEVQKTTGYVFIGIFSFLLLLTLIRICVALYRIHQISKKIKGAEMKIKEIQKALGLQSKEQIVKRLWAQYRLR